MRIRPYSATDYDVCCHLFDSNIPKFFDPSEKSDFESFLKEYAHENYWVAEMGNDVVACGGIRIKPNGIGGLSYGLVRQDLHHSGIGRKLADFRIKKLLELPEISTIQLETSQHTYGFFEKFGFITTQIQKDYFGEGLDCYSMELRNQTRANTWDLAPK